MQIALTNVRFEGKNGHDANGPSCLLINIEFPVTFNDAAQDQQLPTRLLNEASGILNWALQGYAEWKRQGLNPPDRIQSATKSYQTDNDPVGQFIESCCCEDPKAKATAKELYDA